MLGFTGDHDVGQEGIELAQQEWLGGKPGSRRVIINRRGEVVEDVASIRAPQEGRDLALSIDTRLQYLAFRELKAAVEANKAKAGGLVILDVRTGEILALANWPTYNPNNRNRTAREQMRNRALTDMFEPGSTLKPFTIAAALDTGKMRPDTVIQTAPGTLTIGNATIHDAHRARRVDGRAGDPEIVEHRRGQDRAVAAAGDDVANALRNPASATPPKTGFPGEVSGRLRPAKTWRPIEQATMAYGHGISVNLVQLARAYTVFATDGELKPVTLLKVDGPVAGRPVVRPETARSVRAHARARGAAGRHRAEGAGRRLSRRRQDGHRAQARRSRLRQQVRRVVRRLRAGVESAT